jgi:hypothetical protein
MPDPLKKTLELVMKRAEWIGSTFTEPDTDWQPVAIIYALKRQSVLPLQWGDPGGQRYVMEIQLPIVLRAEQAAAVVLVLPVWRTEREGAGQPAPSQTPNRTEHLLVQAMSAIGHYLRMAEIHRSATAPPTLGEWVDVLDGVEKITGRGVEPIRRALVRQG